MATSVILLPCVCVHDVIDFSYGPRGEAGAQRDDAVNKFQAYDDLSLPERPRGHCWDQPVSSSPMEQANRVAVCEILVVLLKIVLHF